MQYFRLNPEYRLARIVADWRATAKVLGYNEALHVYVSKGHCFVSVELYNHCFSD